MPYSRPPFIVILFGLLLVNSCASSSEVEGEQSVQYDTLKVTATAYNSIEAQTKQGNPSLAAWGDTLKPGMKVIAISRDLLEEGVLGHNSEVSIQGLEGTYKVMDKMNKRWNRKIDIYMGLDVQAALQWGKKEVEIYIPKKIR